MAPAGALLGTPVGVPPFSDVLTARGRTHEGGAL
nr:MAG TPA: hypothetical protein [Caudoviricetes sp.]